MIDSYRILPALVLSFLCITARADIINVNDAGTLQSAISTAKDGDEILLSPGVYRGRFASTDLVGVTIRSADPANRAVINAANFGEGIKLSSASRVTISDLIVEKARNNGINIDDGSGQALSTDITLRNIEVRSSDDKGILLAGVDRFKLDRVNVIGWGPSAAAISLAGVHNGIIERSLFDNTTPGTGVGIQAKGGSSNVIIRANRFSDANERSIQLGGETALPQHRPQPPSNVESSKIIAEGNVILNAGIGGSPNIRSGIAFVNTADGMVRNNFIYRPTKYVMRILKENRNEGFIDTQNGQFMNNVIVWDRGDIEEAVNTGAFTQPATFKFDGNQWFNRTAPDRSKPFLPSQETNGVYGVDPNLTPDSLMPWNYGWGQWVVNATNKNRPLTFDANTPMFLATPGPDGMFDLGLQDPLLGEWTFSKLNPEQGFALDAFSYALLFKQAPTESMPCDLDLNGVCDVADIELLSQIVRSGMNEAGFDLNGDKLVSQEDRRIWIEDLMKTYFGDSNLDGEFNTRDLVDIFIASQYEDAIEDNSYWAAGDWDGDGDFATSDLVLAFVSDGFEKGPRVAVAIVPEPSSQSWLISFFFAMWSWRALGIRPYYGVVRRRPH